MTEPNILERVRRLLALAESSNVHEAAAAAAKAQELITKHRIDLADLDVEGGIEEPVLTEDVEVVHGRKPWRELLLGALARANGCESYNSRNRQTGRVRLLVIGPASGASVVRYMHAYLTREVERLNIIGAKQARTELRAVGLDPRGITGRWHNSFKLGAVVELRRRLLEASTRTMAGASGTALARIEKADARVAEAFAALKLGKARKAVCRHSAAFDAGRDAGASINLDRGSPALPAGASGALRSGT
jgi:hypothetical protein